MLGVYLPRGEGAASELDTLVGRRVLLADRTYRSVGRSGRVAVLKEDYWLTSLKPKTPSS
jgi:hypothetical protein